MHQKPLRIQWNIANHGCLEVVDWHLWQDIVNLTDKNSLETELWLEFVHQARKMGLPRTTGWDVSGLCESQQLLAVQAARSYLRGVPVRGHSAQIEGAEKSGQYDYRQLCLAEIEQLFTQESFTLMDKKVLAHHQFELLPDSSCLLEGGEACKKFELVRQLIDAWRKAGQPPRWVIVGGGSLCDSAAYAAHLVGCAYILVPTTLLAMVDACVGGKTAVNLEPWGKNILGAFSYPHAVLTSTTFLESLPDIELDSGIFEALKHGLLAGQKSQVRALLAQLSSRRKQARLELGVDQLMQNIEVKAKVIEQDSTELKGLRHCLNYGHTLGHALESYHLSRQSYLPHGICVGFGMLFANLLGAALGITESEFTIESEILLKAALDSFTREVFVSPFELAGQGEQLWQLMLQDKKNSTSDLEQVNWVFLANWGQLAHPVGQAGYLHPVSKQQFLASFTHFTWLLGLRP